MLRYAQKAFIWNPGLRRKDKGEAGIIKTCGKTQL